MRTALVGIINCTNPWGKKRLDEEQFFTIGVATLRIVCFEGKGKKRKRSSDIEGSCCKGNKGSVASPELVVMKSNFNYHNEDLI